MCMSCNFQYRESGDEDLFSCYGCGLEIGEKEKNVWYDEENKTVYHRNEDCFDNPLVEESAVSKNLLINRRILITRTEALTLFEVDFLVKPKKNIEKKVE